uniref:Col_cuticle_N domain-containing protein n=1 Tax=Steinernema glaseri TaxID=37863 RepID=A0A1I7Z1T7_9BILA
MRAINAKHEIVLHVLYVPLPIRLSPTVQKAGGGRMLSEDDWKMSEGGQWTVNSALQPVVSSDMEECGLKWWVRAAAALAGTAFVALVITVPVLMNDVTLMEEQLALQRVEYLEMSNVMWEELMAQEQEIKYTRVSRDTQRVRRQYDSSDSEKPSTGAEKKPLVCPAGPPGPPGAAGEKGDDGENGIPGLPGNNGGDDSAFTPSDNPYEATAVAGSSCLPCPSGPPGYPGYKGKRGQRGQKGPKGAQGAPGRDGELGEEGPEGERGYPGDQGVQGEKGAPGEDGIGYAKGAPGPRGEPGMPGMVGDEGMPGERGDDAIAGPQGETGPVGPPGEPGKDGVAGFAGKPGPHGADAEYCPCPERSKEAADDKRGSGIYDLIKDTSAHTVAESKPPALEPVTETLPPSQEPVPASLKTAESIYDKRARAAALRRRH